MEKIGNCVYVKCFTENKLDIIRYSLDSWSTFLGTHDILIKSIKFFISDGMNYQKFI